jgi:hypothetical protein
MLLLAESVQSVWILGQGKRRVPEQTGSVTGMDAYGDSDMYDMRASMDDRNSSAHT